MMRDQGRVTFGLLVLHSIVQKEINKDSIDFWAWVLTLNFAAQELNAPDAAPC